ncbi:DUF881 domain-containing protein [Kitasatospora sp. NPDC056181]|uniref:DUF881 domain-containing protein n=1 Tax=Kitasatospora sp. NPDC056181 TaxID=3345737 RepID=UPI0035DBE3D8
MEQVEPSEEKLTAEATESSEKAVPGAEEAPPAPTGAREKPAGRPEAGAPEPVPASAEDPEPEPAAESKAVEPDADESVAGPKAVEPEVKAVEAAAAEPEPEAAKPEPEPKAVEPEAAEVGPEVKAVEPEADEPVPAPPVVDRGAGRRRLKAALWPPRLSRGQLVVALLLFSLGLALAIQVRSTNDHHSQLRGARQEDLVRILDELDGRQQRLQQERAELEQSLAKLENSSNQAKEAQEQTRKKVTELGVLAGTVKATGPGIVLTVDDPQGQVKADMLLDTLQELRAAGAEAIQINDVRVVVNTYFTDVSGGGVQIDGKKVSQPYRFTVVGNPQDLTPALNIPGGVVRTLESHQARATISQQQKVIVDALVDLKTPQYAKPATK